MTLSECYTALGGDYGEVLGRLRSENLIRKFVLKFPDDPSYRLLCDAMEAGEREEAFRGAHTIKGVCQNLSFTTLYRSSAQLCEALRDSFRPEAADLLRQVEEDYGKTVSAIREFQASQPV